MIQITLKIKKKNVEWEITNNGCDPLIISSIELTWPASNGNLKKVKLGEETIFEQELPPPSATINSGWEGEPKDRTIDAGKTEKLKFEFENDAGTNQDDYAIRVEFGDDCEIVFTYCGCPFECKKPIEAFAMIWDGTQSIRVKAWKGPVGSTLLADVDNIAIGDELTVSGYTGSPNDVFWEIFEAGTDNKIGESKFHLSCSDPDMNGPEDCGKRQGNGKDTCPCLINDWILEGMVDSVGSFDCTP